MSFFIALQGFRFKLFSFFVRFYFLFDFALFRYPSPPIICLMVLDAALIEQGWRFSVIYRSE